MTKTKTENLTKAYVILDSGLHTEEDNLMIIYQLPFEDGTNDEKAEFVSLKPHGGVGFGMASWRRYLESCALVAEICTDDAQYTITIKIARHLVDTSLSKEG